MDAAPERQTLKHLASGEYDLFLPLETFHI